MNIITILKTALEFLALVTNTITKLVTRYTAWARSRRRARQQRVQSIGRATFRGERWMSRRRVDGPWISRRFAARPSFAEVDRSPVAASADDVLLRPGLEQQPLASYTTRPVLANKLTRR
jgi:hypothetical protein